MTNPPKQKGTWGETHAAKWFRVNGFPGADRKALKGNGDQGDLDLCPGVIAEIKNVKLTTGVPAKAQLTKWMAEAEAERANAGASLCPLIVKRPGTQDVGQWFAYLPMEEFVHLQARQGEWGTPWSDYGPAMVDVATLALILRNAGYGTPLEDGAA